MRLNAQQSHVGRQALGPDQNLIELSWHIGHWKAQWFRRQQLVAMTTVAIAAFSAILAILPVASTASAGNAPISDALPSLRS